MKKINVSIKAEVISRHLLCTAEEMAAALIRLSFSPNIKERADCSTTIFDQFGQVIAQAHRVPIHLGSMIGAIDAILSKYNKNEIKPGDMFAVNDPYNGGGTHLPDINIVAPVFFEDEIVAYVANIAHHADVGGMVPGSESAICKTIFQEGLRIPVVRIVSNNQINQDVYDIILLNSRTPEERHGDLRAQISTNNVGINGVLKIFEKYGSTQTKSLISSYLDFTEDRFSSRIKELPDGTYNALDYLDGDNPSETCEINLKLTIKSRNLIFDFKRSGPQLNSSRNIPHQALLATIYTVAKSLIDPDIPANAGYFRCIEIKVFHGTVVAPIMPAAVGCRSISCGVLGDVIASAISGAMPVKAIAGCGPHHLIVLSGIDPRKERYFVSYETIAGGMGARPNSKGIDAVRVHASGAANLPIEALENSYPFRIIKYALRQKSGGQGINVGGMGVVREYLVEADEASVSLSAERQNIPAQGINGGFEGALGQFTLNPDTPIEKRLPSAVGDLLLPKGTVLRVETPGGGGSGVLKSKDK